MNSIQACFLAGLLLGVLIAGIGVYKWTEISKIEAIAAQKNADTQSCNTDKAITQKAEADYETKVRDLSSRLAALSLLPSTCVPVITSHTGNTPAKVKHRPAKANAGITSTALYQYAGQCEADRLQLNSLIDVIHAIQNRTTPADFKLF